MNATPGTLQQARDEYLQRYGFSTAAYTEQWARIKLGPIAIWIPSTRSRREAIRFHDLHHALTGYPATPKGEAQIAAWELATGCARFPAALVLNTLALGLGVVIAPRLSMRAYARGKATLRNLYKGEVSDELLARDLEQVRREIELPPVAPPVNARDVVGYAGWLAFSAALYAMLAAIPIAAMAATVWYFFIQG